MVSNVPVAPTAIHSAINSMARDNQTAPWLVTVPVASEIFADAGQTQPALRANIFKAEDRLNSRGERVPGNGLAAHQAIVRRGRKVLIDVRRYGNWLAGREPAEV